MSEKFKELIAILMAYNVPFRFRPKTEYNSGAWIFGYTVEDGVEVNIWEVDDMPIPNDVLFFREGENDICDDGASGLSVNSIMLHILAREKEVNGADYV